MKSNKNLLLIILLSSFIATNLTGCENNTNTNTTSLEQTNNNITTVIKHENIPEIQPETIVKSYLEAVKAKDYDKAYTYLTKEYKDNCTLVEYKARFDKESSNTYADVIANQMKFDVGSATVKTIAKIETTVTIPSIKQMMGELFLAALGGIFENDEKAKEQRQQAIIASLTERINTGNYPTETTKEYYELIKEGIEWKVSIPLPTIKANKDSNTTDKKQECKQLIKEMIDIQYKNEQEAYKLCKKLEQYPETDFPDYYPKEKIMQKINNIEEALAYIPNVELYDLKASYHDTWSQKNIVGVNFKLKNKGNKALKTVEVTVFFKDKDGSIIHEETYHPVLVTDGYGSDKPLKPNYIWQQEKNRLLSAPGVPDEWKNGAVEAKITKVELAE